MLLLYTSKSIIYLTIIIYLNIIYTIKTLIKYNKNIKPEYFKAIN
jgi:hypothetical protein